MSKIAGLDICKGWAVAWILEDIPDDVKADYQRGLKFRNRDPEKDEFTFYFCHDQFEKVLKPGTKTIKINGTAKIKQGIETFLSWGIDTVVMEPTGLHYAYFISKVCEKHGIKVLWISHDVCKAIRRQHNLPDKNDLADAYVLAIQGIIYGHKPSYWIRFENGNILKMRDLYHFRKFVSKLSVKPNNRSQQHLAYEYPESVALFKDAFSLDKDDRRSPLIRVVAGRVPNRSPWPKRLNNSIAKEYGIEITDSTRYLCTLTDDFHCKLIEINEELERLVFHPQFSVYNHVFDRFSFGLSLRAIILILVYPFSERFPESLLTSKRLAKFKRRLGIARIETQSGISVKGEKTGSSSGLCRSEFYMHVASQYKLQARRSSYVPATPEIALIKQYHDKKEAELKADPEALAAIINQRYQDSQRSKLYDSLIFSGISKGQALTIVDSMDWSIKKPQAIEKSRLVGDLVIARTSAYVCKQLFKALEEFRDSLDK